MNAVTEILITGLLTMIQIGLLVSLSKAVRCIEADSQAFILSLIYGICYSVFGIVFVIGLSPFFHIHHAPVTYFLVLYLLTSIFCFGKVEFLGNIVIDSLISGLIIVSTSAVIATGFVVLFNRVDVQKLLWPWVFLCLAMAIFFRIFFWLKK